MAARYVLSESGEHYRFVLKAGNNEIILTSQMYASKSGALKGIDSVKANSADDDHYVRKDASNGMPMFNLKAGNGEIIGTSEIYSTKAARDKGIDSVKSNGPAASVDDQTLRPDGTSQKPR